MKKNMITAAVAALTVTAAAYGQDWGVTTVSANYLRAMPEYTSPLETQTLMGSVVETGSSEGRWTSVIPKAPSYGPCWTNAKTIVRMSDDQIKEYIAAEKYICTEDFSHVYDAPVAGNVICDLVMGDLVRKVFSERGRAVHTVTHAKVMLPDGRTGYVKYGDVNDFRTWLDNRTTDGPSIVATARRFTGTPYLWGGNSTKGVDCSGLVWMAYFMNGILLPRNASDMARCGEEVPLQALRTGDLIFYSDEDGHINHVAIYTGEAGIIHSSQIVYEASISPDSPYYFDRHIVCARRILGHLGGGASLISSSPWFVATADAAFL